MSGKLLDRVRRIIRLKHYSLQTMIYTHVIEHGALGACSPLDRLG